MIERVRANERDQGRLQQIHVLLVDAGSPLAAAKRALGLPQLERLPLIVCSQSAAVDAFCQAHGIAAQIRHRIDDNEKLVGLAAVSFRSNWRASRPRGSSRSPGTATVSKPSPRER